jgi:hypothetical protein
MALLEVRTKELGPVLSGEPGCGEERGDEQHSKDDAYEFVRHVTSLRLW